ncbi:MAG: hypothetical protein ACRDHS_07010 [Actinomycetota bacterium]
MELDGLADLDPVSYRDGPALRIGADDPADQEIASGELRLVRVDDRLLEGRRSASGLASSGYRQPIVSDPLRWEEKLAARCIGAELGVEVASHDDGSAQGMYDLKILYPDRAPGAIEVTAAADAESIALGKLVYDRERWIVPGITGGWMVVLQPTARMKNLRAQLPALLRTLESQSIRWAQPEVWWEPGPFGDALRALGILHLFQSGTDFPGSVYLNIEQGLERTTGILPTDGRPLLEWLSVWLARPDKAENLAKLAASGADERHLFLNLACVCRSTFRSYGPTDARRCAAA